MTVRALKYHVTYSQFFVATSELESLAATDGFSVHVDGSSAVVELHAVTSSVVEARSLVDPFLRAWEIEAGLVRGYPMLSFEYVGSEESLDGQSRSTLGVSFDALIAFELSTLPPPPQNQAPSLWADIVWGHFRGYREGAQALLPTAYACLTVVEASAPAGRGHARHRAATYYGLDRAELIRLGKLTAIGDPVHGRKYTGVPGALSKDELVWIETMLTKMVRAVCGRHRPVRIIAKAK